MSFISMILSNPLTVFKITSAMIILFASILGGVWPLLSSAKNQTHLDFSGGESLASGIFLGAGLLHMLPDAAEGFTKIGIHYPVVYLMTALSFLFLLFLEHLSVSFKKEANGSHSKSSPSNIPFSISILAVIILSLHSIFEGTAIGLSQNFLTAGMIFIAVIAHKSAAAFALAMQLKRGHLNQKTKFIGFSIFALMTPVGIFAGNFVLQIYTQLNLLIPIFNALAAGTFLYIGTLHGLERAILIKHCCNIKEFIIMLCGFTLMACAALWT